MGERKRATPSEYQNPLYHQSQLALKEYQDPEQARWYYHDPEQARSPARINEDRQTATEQLLQERKRNKEKGNDLTPSECQKLGSLYGEEENDDQAEEEYDKEQARSPA